MSNVGIPTPSPTPKAILSLLGESLLLLLPEDEDEGVEDDAGGAEVEEEGLEGAEDPDPGSEHVDVPPSPAEMI